MKSQISSLDLHYLLKEMQFLIGGRLDKAYHPNKEEILLQFHLTNKGKQLLRIVSGKFIFLSEHKEVYDNPSGFCMFLRKYLSNSRLKEISQISSERIVLIRFETKETEYRMYVELFGKGNVVLADKEDMIINALEIQKWSDREIKKGLKYEHSKKEFNLFELKKEELDKILDSDKETVYKLAKVLGLGGVYAEELCERAGIDKKKKVLEKKEKEKVYSELKEMISSRIEARIILNKGRIEEIIPFDFDICKDSEKKEFSSFNEAFDFFFKEELASKEEFKSKHQAAIDKAATIVKQQKKQIADLEKKAGQETKKGEAIYENYQKVEEILKEINNARKKYSFDEINQRLKGHKVIKNVDGKDKKVMIEL